MLREEGSQAGDRSSTYRLLEVGDEGPDRFNQLLLALSEDQLLVLNVVNLALVLLDKLMVTFHEDGECALPFLLNLFIIAVYLRLLEALFDLL